MLTIRLFAGLKDAAGLSSLDLEAKDSDTVSDVFSRLAEKYPAMQQFKSCLLVAVNEEYADWLEPVQDGDEIAFFPPVSGGSH